MVEVIINNEQEKIKIGPELENVLISVVEETLRQEGFMLDCEIGISLVENSRIHSLNHEYRGVDRPTDVLSFPLWEDGEDEVDGEVILLGDIVISVEKAVEQALDYGHSFLREIAYLTVHGTLHLLGFDHETDEERKNMRMKEEKVLEKLSITRQVN